MTKNDDSFDLSKLRTKKKRINSGTKGKTFERKLVEILNERFQTTEFARTPGSGAFATTHSLPEHMAIYGDLITPKAFKFTIEAKKGYNKESISSLFNPKSKFHEFIEQAKLDANKANKSFMIILAQDRQDPLVVVNNTSFATFLPEFNEFMVLNYQKDSYLVTKLKNILALPNYMFL